MKSKTSSFNMTIFRKNVSRFWPVWAIYTVLLLFILPFNLLLNSSYQVAMENEGKLDHFLTVLNTNLSPFFCFAFAILIAVMMFSYLFQMRTCQMMHALPVNRRELYITNYFSGLLFMLVPQITVFLFTVIVCICYGVTDVEYLLYWLLVTVLTTFFFYSSGVFCCMLTGTPGAGVAYYIGGNVFYGLLKYILTAIACSLGFGFSDSALINTDAFSTSQDMIFSPIVYMSGTYYLGIVRKYNTDGTVDILNVTVSGIMIALLYIVPALVLFGTGYFLYKKRELENTGDVVIFPWMGPVFRWIIGFCAGTALTYLAAKLFFSDFENQAKIQMILAVPLSMIGFWAAQMILRKRVKVYQMRILAESICCAAICLLVFAGISADYLGVEKRIPQISQVRMVSFTANNVTQIFDDVDGIEAVEDIHSNILEHRQEYHALDVDEILYDESDDEEMQLCECEIAYVLKSGRVLERLYYIPVDAQLLEDETSPAGQIAQLQSDPEVYLTNAIGLNYKEADWLTSSVSFYDSGGYIGLDEKQTEKLYKAIQQDLREGLYPYGIRALIVPEDEVYALSIDMTGLAQEEMVNPGDWFEAQRLYRKNSADEYIYESEGGIEAYVYFSLYQSCRHTVEVMTEMGLLEPEEQQIGSAAQ